MSEDPTLITAQHFDYLAERTVREDGFLADLKREALAAGIPGIWIAPEQASFMQILLRLARVRDVVEVGTLVGYSAIWMARALPDGGRVHTIEVSSRHADFAARWIAKSDVAGKITIHRGAAKDILPRFESASAGAVFLDADKKNYPAYLNESLRIVRAGGLIMADNAFGFGQLFEKQPTRNDVEDMRLFNDIMAAEAALQKIIVPLGDGLWVGVKL